MIVLMNTMIVAHRGGAGDEPRLLENTLQAFRRAAAAGYDSIETDLRAAADGTIHCLHDSTLTRTAESAGRLKSFSREKLAAVRMKNGEPLPSLDDLLSLAREHNRGRGKKISLHLEVKETGFEPRLARQIEEAGMTGDVLVISFHKTALENLHRQNPGIRTGYLFARGDGLKSCPAFSPVVLPALRLVTERRIAAWRGAGKEVHVWTVNDPRDAEKLGGKVDAIITDVPRKLTSPPA